MVRAYQYGMALYQDVCPPSAVPEIQALTKLVSVGVFFLLQY